jgi:hypothetical protein
LSTVSDPAPRGIDMVAPVIRRLLTALLGWRYDGSETARHRLVRQLPIVAFRLALRTRLVCSVMSVSL